ncbi:MAG: glycosyltransferase family 4 protein [Planctomycetes bacterium]|nr:glycosyltransferase family 4 protein [Planctomycetota bacterium]
MKPAKPTRVLHIITRLILGGAQEDTLLLVNGLQKKPQYQIYLATGPAIGPEGELVTRAKGYKINLLFIPELRRNICPIRDFIAFIKIYRLISNMRPDIVHTHSSKAGILGRLAAKMAGVKTIVHSIYGLPFHPFQNKLVNLFYILAERFCAPFTTKLISIADAMTRQSLAAGVGRREQFETIRSGIELENFLGEPDRTDELRTKYGIAETDKVIGTVARLFPLKGHEFLLEIAPRLIAKFPDVKFMLVGDGILRTQIEDEIARKGMEKHFVFTGHVKPELIPHLIRLMNVLVHPSLREGLARALPQALIMKKPAVSFELDGAGEVIINGKTGFLVTPKDANALYSAVETLLSDDANARKMGNRGYELVKDWFDGKTMVEKVHKLYQKLLE